MPSTDLICVKLSIPCDTIYGQEVRIVGSLPKLGSWDSFKGPVLLWGSGNIWTLELMFEKSELPCEYKYVITSKEKKKRKKEERKENNQNFEEETEVEEFKAVWETTPNRIIKGDKLMLELKDKWEKLPELENALEERNYLFEELRAFENVSFPYFTQFPRHLGSRELAIGIIGEPDKAYLKSLGVAKDKTNTVFMEGILRKTEGNRYEIFWFGRQHFYSHLIAEKKCDVSELLPIDSKWLTFDDKTSLEVSEVVRDGVVDSNTTFQTVIANLRGDGTSTTEGIQWDPVTKKWSFVQRFFSSSITRKQKKNLEFAPPSVLNNEGGTTSVRVHSADKKTGMVAYQNIPGSTDIVVLQTTVSENDFLTFVSVIDEHGNSLMPLTYIAPLRYEGSMLVRDMNASQQDPFAGSAECDLTDLRKKEKKVRESIDPAQKKYLLLKEQSQAITC